MDKIEPSVQEVMEGENAVFNCFSLTPVNWVHDGDILPENAEENDNSIYISKVKSTNQGFYECEGTYTSGRKFHSRGRLKIRCMLSVS